MFRSNLRLRGSFTKSLLYMGKGPYCCNQVRYIPGDPSRKALRMTEVKIRRHGQMHPFLGTDSTKVVAGVLLKATAPTTGQPLFQIREARPIFAQGSWTFVLFSFDIGTRMLGVEMLVSYLGFSVVRYALGSRETSHLFLQPEGRTFCGVKTRGSRWKTGDKFDPVQDCQRCARRIRRGITRLLTCCPKCASDFGVKFPLLPNRKCPNCVSVWN